MGAALFLLFLFSSADARQGAADGLWLWGALLVPSLLPYFAAAGLLTRLGAVDALARRLAPAAARLFGVSGAGAAVFLLGLSGGYPLGAASIGALYRDGLLQRDEAEDLLAFCDNSGPAFAVGALGVGVFGSAGWGMLLWGIHAISAAAVGILFRRRTRGAAKPDQTAAEDAGLWVAALGGAVTAAGQTILQIGAYVIFFFCADRVFRRAGFPTRSRASCALHRRGRSFFRALFSPARLSLERRRRNGGPAAHARKPCAGRISAELVAVRPRTGRSCRRRAGKCKTPRRKAPPGRFLRSFAYVAASIIM